MITTAEEWRENQWRLNDGNIPTVAILLPTEESIYEIDLNKRTIKAPPFLSVKTDHTAETIYFVCDRYYDNMDLSNTVCVVQYINAKGEGRLFSVPFVDITTFSSEGEKKYIKAYVIASNYEKGVYYIKQGEEYVLAEGAFDSKADYYSYVDQPKILFPWIIEGGATAAAGVVQYAVQFYMLDEAGKEVIYILNTRPTQSKVLEGMNVLDTAEDIIPPTELQILLDRVNNLEKEWNLYWIEA